jgi:hypothetical protein
MINDQAIDVDLPHEAADELNERFGSQVHCKFWDIQEIFLPWWIGYRESVVSIRY